MGRVVGFASFYSNPSLGVPPKIFVIIEQFDSLAAAEEFYDYPFKPEFRNYGYESKVLNLEGADEARIRWKRDLEGETKDTYTVVVEFRYYNMYVIVETTGVLDNFPAAYAKIGAKTIIEILGR